MSVTYLLPCHGENHVEITVADAGRSIACPCGKQVAVPTLREIRRLPRKQQMRAASAPAWSTQQGVLFSIGLVLIAGCLVTLAVLGYQCLQLDTDKIVLPEKDVALQNQRIMEMEAAQLLDIWQRDLSPPLPEQRRLPPFEVHRAIARGLYTWMAVAGVVGVVGVVFACAGLFLRPKPGKRKRGPRKRPTPSS